MLEYHKGSQMPKVHCPLGVNYRMEKTVCSDSAPAKKLESLRAKYAKVDFEPRDHLHN